MVPLCRAACTARGLVAPLHALLALLLLTLLGAGITPTPASAGTLYFPGRVGPVKYALGNIMKSAKAGPAFVGTTRRLLPTCFRSAGHCCATACRVAPLVLRVMSWGEGAPAAGGGRGLDPPFAAAACPLAVGVWRLQKETDPASALGEVTFFRNKLIYGRSTDFALLPRCDTPGLMWAVGRRGAAGLVWAPAGGGAGGASTTATAVAHSKCVTSCDRILSSAAPATPRCLKPTQKKLLAFGACAAGCRSKRS